MRRPNRRTAPARRHARASRHAPAKIRDLRSGSIRYRTAALAPRPWAHARRQAFYFVACLSACSSRAASTYFAALGLAAFQRGACGSLAMVRIASATVRSIAAMLS